MILLDETLDKLRTEHRAYQETDLPDASHLRFEVYYSKGGLNYISGESSRRGYYLSITPVKRERHSLSDGTAYTTESQSLFRGIKYFLNVDEISRKSQKAEAKAMEAVNRGIVSTLIKEVERDG